MSKLCGGVRGFDSVPDEVLMLILDHHFDIMRHASFKQSKPQSTAPRLQFHYELQMSLCLVSRRFNRLISYLLRRNGLIRVTCLLDPHLDFYYLLPSICHSEHANMFQIPCPHLGIDLSRGIPDPLMVESIICVGVLPTLLDLVQLHHAAGRTLLPNVFDVHSLNGRTRMSITSETGAEFELRTSVASSIIRHLPALQEVTGAEGQVSYELGEQAQGLPQTLPLWTVAFQIARLHCLSKDVDRRRLGLQILRYLLVSMLVVVDPWHANAAPSQHFETGLRMMALSSAVLIDALMVEPNMLEIFYGRNVSGAADTFHREICPCTYLPHDMVPLNGRDHTGTPELWPFVHLAMHFFHCLLTCDRNIRRARLERFRQSRAGLTSSTGIEERRSVYIKALERSVECCACSACIASEATLNFPDFG